PPNMARPVSIDAGIPIPVPQYTVAKACGCLFTAIQVGIAKACPGKYNCH
ncbi:MAG: acetyl-CoA C-acyltransferase, partial [Deltaproteobacteria bacterium]|nr:acetyl-CoA C-acyltransferase [Deltaproteobacteria bacterium]